MREIGESADAVAIQLVSRLGDVCGGADSICKRGERTVSRGSTARRN